MLCWEDGEERVSLASGPFPEGNGKEGVLTKDNRLKVPRAAWCNYPSGLQTFHAQTAGVSACS